MTNTTFKSLRAFVAIAGLALWSSSWAQSDATATKFLTDAIRGNIAEVKMGELAQQRGKSKAVREFGETLVTDHTMGLQKTSALAKTLGVTPPTEPAADAIKMHEAMSKLSGEEFDRAFASHMVTGHEQEIAKYKEQTKDGGNPEVAALAKATLPTLEKHLATAQAINRDQSGLTSSR
jgi:putative membrane protein